MIKTAGANTLSILLYGCNHSRYNRARLERLRRAREEADFEKIFKQSFWSYSKSMLKQPLSVLEGEKGDELEEIALQLFYTIQQHAGIPQECRAMWMHGTH